MVCETKKIDSNVTGLRYAEEECIGELPVSGVVWYGQEPNSYDDFGGQITTVARNPINPSRQRKKGAVTDLEASGGYNQDVTDYNLTRLMQGFMFADARQKPSLHPLNGTQNTVTSATASTNTYAVNAGGAAFVANRLVKASGFGIAANNGLKVVASSTATTVVVGAGLADEPSAPATANLEVVGHQFASGDLSIAMVGGLPALTSAAYTMTNLGLIPGEWIFVGGDATANQFASGQNGIARVVSISATQVILDKVSWVTPTTDAGTGKTIRIFMGIVIRNESDPLLIKRRSYDLERTLGQDADGIQSEHLIGAVPSEFTLNVTNADKVTVDMSYTAIDHVTRTGSEGLVAGTRPDIPVSDAYNTSSDFSRIKLASVPAGSAVPAPLFAFATELTLTINNNLSANKAIGVLGAMDVSAGTFEVGGSMTVYFADVLATRAVRNNADVTLDLFMAKNNSGLLFDLPLLTLGDGRANVEQDQPIMLPLENMAAESSFGNTLTYMSFPYLPSLAEA